MHKQGGTECHLFLDNVYGDGSCSWPVILLDSATLSFKILNCFFFKAITGEICELNQIWDDLSVFLLLFVQLCYFSDHGLSVLTYPSSSKPIIYINRLNTLRYWLCKVN